MRRLLGTLQNPSETSHSPKKCVDLIDLTQETQISSNSPNEKFKQTAALNAGVQNPTNLMISGTDINVMNLSTVDHNQQSSISVNRSETPSTNLEPVFNESVLPPRSIVSHLARRRGRGKRHRGGFYRGFPGRPSNMGSSELVTKDSDKSRVSRELRGLVTWDAVMAEQRKREQEQKELVEKGEPPVFRPAEVALSVVTELIASVEEEDTLTPKLRRTRQSSGSVHSHATHSAVGSETASMQTTVTREFILILFFSHFTNASVFFSFCEMSVLQSVYVCTFIVYFPSET
ncbi:unnamed protein product [Trichobilharzia regenti]|nr:unnamed protein product [Trichobilharzia regenti]